MNVVFGQLVGQFNNYAAPGTNQPQSEFESLLNKQRWRR